MNGKNYELYKKHKTDIFNMIWNSIVDKFNHAHS